RQRRCSKVSCDFTKPKRSYPSRVRSRAPMRTGLKAQKLKSGFTILEVLLATVLFGYIVLALVGTKSASLRHVNKSKKIFEAVQLAQQKMVEMEIKYQKLKSE